MKIIRIVILALVVIGFTVSALWFTNRSVAPKEATWDDVVAEAKMGGYRLINIEELAERYLRLVYFPFTPMNFGMGLTRVHFWDYFFGTGLGIIVGTFIFLFFIGTLKEVWASGNWAELLSSKVFFSVVLFIFSLFIPKIINKFKGDRGIRGV